MIKENTYNHTKRLVEKRMSINDICKSRGLKHRTILDHLHVIVERYPKCDLSYLKEEDKTIERVRQVYLELNEDEKGTKKKIFEKLKGKVSYDDIELALVFVKQDILN